MFNNQFRKAELYSFVTGKASTALGRRLQQKFNEAAVPLTIEQWSVLYPLWQTDGQSQRELCLATFRDKPSITRLLDNLEKANLVKRVAEATDRRMNRVHLTRHAKALERKTIPLAEDTLNEALAGVSAEHLEICKSVLQIVYDNLKSR